MSEEQPPPGRGDADAASHDPVVDAAAEPSGDHAGAEELFEALDELDGDGRSTETRTELRETRDLLAAAHERGLIESDHRELRASGAVEALVGSIFFSVPFLFEDGVFEVADYFLSFRVGPFPVFFLVNAAFVLLMIAALVYWAGPQEVQVYRPILGVVPRRLVGIAAVSFLTAAALMTMWGRVAGWQDPVVGLARVSVVWTVASFGAALGDILPGESSGDDINDELGELGERFEEPAGDGEAG